MMNRPSTSARVTTSAARCTSSRANRLAARDALVGTSTKLRLGFDATPCGVVECQHRVTMLSECATYILLCCAAVCSLHAALVSQGQAKASTEHCRYQQRAATPHVVSMGMWQYHTHTHSACLQLPGLLHRKGTLHEVDTHDEG